MCGHILNRACFLWAVLFGITAGCVLQIDILVINVLDWDEDDAAAVK